MSELISNLNTIESCKLDIKSAIEAKGVSMSGVSFPDYATAIGSITTQFVTESLSVSQNGTYTPGQGVDGFSQVSVNVPQSVTGYTEKEITEGVQIASLNNNAGYVGKYAFAEKNIQTVDLPEASYIDSYAFYECKSLTNVNLPVCLSLYGSVFAGCSSLTSISLPTCIYINGGTVFANCGCSEIDLPMVVSTLNNTFRGSYITSVSLPICVELNQGTFISCGNLQSLTLGLYTYRMVNYNNPFNQTAGFMTSGKIYVAEELYNSYITANGWSALSSLFVSVSLSGSLLSYSDGTIYGCTHYTSEYIHEHLGIAKSVVTEINLPDCKYIGSKTFNGFNNVESLNIANAVYIGEEAIPFKKITSLNLPNCLYLGYGAVGGCSSLTSISVPECRYLGSFALNYGSNLTSINLPKCDYIGSSAFARCSSVPVYITNSTVCSLGGSSLGYSFTGSIYVPASLVDTYKAAPNWSDNASRIFPIPE